MSGRYFGCPSLGMVDRKWAVQWTSRDRALAASELIREQGRWTDLPSFSSSPHCFCLKTA